jgi:hypothetical protein
LLHTLFTFHPSCPAPVGSLFLFFDRYKTSHHDTQALPIEWMSFGIFMIYCLIGILKINYVLFTTYL